MYLFYVHELKVRFVESAVQYNHVISGLFRSVILKCLFNLTLYIRHYIHPHSGCINIASGYIEVLLNMDRDMDNKKPRNKIPPDGGWGWMIVFANALSNVRYYLLYDL